MRSAGIYEVDGLDSIDAGGRCPAKLFGQGAVRCNRFRHSPSGVGTSLSCCLPPPQNLR